MIFLLKIHHVLKTRTKVVHNKVNITTRSDNFIEKNKKNPDTVSPNLKNDL